MSKEPGALQFGIETKPIYKPTHEEKVFVSYDTGDLVRAAETLGRSLCLPMHSGMSEQDVDYVSERLVAEIQERL